MSFRGRFLAAALGAGIAVAAGQTSAAVFYECDLQTKNPRGWVSPKMGFVIDDAGQVTVIDSAILNFIGKPLVAKARKSGGNLRISWSIAGAQDSKGQRIPTFRYVATLNTAKRTVAVVAKPTSAPQSWRGKGTCKTRSGGFPKLR